MSTGLYLHIPFCARQCDFCAFYTAPIAEGRVDEFLDALIRELRIITRSEPFVPNTIFFGGGTPSLLTTEQFDRLLTAMRSLGLIGPALREFTIEAMPATLTASKTSLWREYGVNRISLGAQSFDDTLLDRLGRAHSLAAIHQSVALLRAAGFDNLNLDLIFAIPGQTTDQWLATLRSAIAQAPDHVSTYELTYEEGSVLLAQRNAGAVQPVDVETAVTMYEQGIALLSAAGYAQYEISNFAVVKPPTDRRCLHNLNCWRGCDYIGVGPSAVGHWHATRYQNVADLDAYLAALSQDERPIIFQETLPPLQRAGELAAFALRMNEGLDSDWFRQQTGFHPSDLWQQEITELCAEDLLDNDAHRLRLTARGRLLADSVAERFIISPAPLPVVAQRTIFSA